MNAFDFVVAFGQQISAEEMPITLAAQGIACDQMLADLDDYVLVIQRAGEIHRAAQNFGVLGARGNGSLERPCLRLETALEPARHDSGDYELAPTGLDRIGGVEGFSNESIRF